MAKPLQIDLEPSPINGVPRLYTLAYFNDLHDRARPFLTERCQKCGTMVAPLVSTDAEGQKSVQKRQFIEVRLRSTRKRGYQAHFKGLQRCSLVWECPVCLVQIKAARAKEVHKALTWWTDQHERDCASMLTLTVSHGFGDDLEKLRTGVAGAWRRLQQSHEARAWWKRLGLKDQGGMIRAHEVTDGPNGWHPHFHVVLLTLEPLLARTRRRQGKWHCRSCGTEHGPAYGRRGPVCNNCKASEFRTWLIDAWCAAVKAELGERYVPSREHGVDLITADRAGQYLHKLGLEISAPGTKHARDGHRTPLDILRAAAYAADGTEEHVAAIERYRMYAHGMKGAKQLFWSQGLKKRAGVEDLTDEEVLAQAESRGVVIAKIPVEQWRLIAWNPGWRMDLLEAAEIGAVCVTELVRIYSEHERQRRAKRGARRVITAGRAGR